MYHPDEDMIYGQSILYKGDENVKKNDHLTIIYFLESKKTLKDSNIKDDLRRTADMRMETEVAIRHSPHDV